MLIVNADDWGRSSAETDAALTCHRAGDVTSVTAMVCMADSERAAQLAKANGVHAGLHLNLTEAFSAKEVPGDLRERQARIARSLKRRWRAERKLLDT